MTPPLKRLRDCTDETSEEGRVGRLLREMPPVAPESSRSHARNLAQLRSLHSSNKRSSPGALQSAAFVSMLVFSFAASAARTWWHPQAPELAPLPPTPVVQEREPEPVKEERVFVQPRKVTAPPPVTSTQVLEPKREAVVKKPVAEVEPPPPQPKPEFLKARLLTDPQKDVSKRMLPKELATAGDTFSVLLEICVSTQGDVTRATILRGEHPDFDERVVSMVTRWKYVPARMNTVAVPACFPHLYSLHVDTNRDAAESDTDPSSQDFSTKVYLRHY